MRRTISLLALVAVCAAAAAHAQTTSSALYGTVTAPNGAPISGAVVQARSVANGTVRTAATDDAGRYRIGLLTPGGWTVAVRLPDGTVTASRNVEVGLQDNAQLDFTGETGLTETVRVTAERPIVDKARTGGEHRVTGSRADVLPIAGRQVTDLALLDSAVVSATPGNYSGERGAVFVLNGQSGRSNSFLVDGLDNNDQLSGTSMNSGFSQQVIQEFVVLTSQFAPEFGRASGGVLNIVTRRGSNELLAEGFLQGTTADWNSSGNFVDRLPGEGRDAVQRFSGGFWLGGPLKRDRAFYFLAYEHRTADELVTWTGVDRSGIAGGRLVAPTRGDNLFFRTDYNLTDDDMLMVRLSADERKADHVNVGGVLTPESGFLIEERDLQLAASWTSIISPRVFNELRLLVGNSEFDQLASSELSAVTRPSGVFGGNQLNSQMRNEDRIQLVENLTWTRGRHTMKFGLDVTRSSIDLSATFNPNGGFLYRTDRPFEPGDCGNLRFNQIVAPDPDNPGSLVINDGPIPCPGTVGVDDDGDGTIDEPGFITTYPLVFSLVDGQPEATFDDTRWALFVQDSWQGKRWKLDYGLRYDVSTFELPDVGVPSSLIPNGGAPRDTDDVAPRFGFSFTPGGRGDLVIRGGAGIFYDKLVLAFPAVAAVTSQTSIGFTFPQGLTIELTEDDIAMRGIDQVRQELFFPQELTLRFSTAPVLDTPYTVQAGLGLEKQLGTRSALRANVTRSLGYHTPIFRDLNPVVGVEFCDRPEFADCPGIPLHRDDQWGSIVAVTTEGRTWYTGVDLGYTWRGDDGWFNAAYTWSKAEDMGFDPLKDGVSLPADSDNIRAEKGRTDNDRRHRLVLSGESAFPWGGLRASVVAQLASGVPFNVVKGVDENLDGFLTERPDGVTRNMGEDTPLDAVNQFRIDEGLAPFGGRLSEPTFFQVDLRLWKPFLYNGGKQGQVYAQIFNLLDRVNGALVEGRANASNFGEVVGLAGPPLTVELGIKLSF